MFDKEHFGRVLIPMVTPFTAEQDVDYERVADLVRRIVRLKLGDSIILSGTTGEFFLLSHSERVKLFEVAVEAAAGEIPVIAGIGCASTRETIELGKDAARFGISAVMVVAPYYSKPTQQELLVHFQTIAANIDQSILLYNIPIFTGVNLQPDTVAELSKVTNVVGIKEEAELNPKQLTEFAIATDEDFAIYCGDDTMITEAYAQCGSKRMCGVISGGSHVASDPIRKLIDQLLVGDLQAASESQAKLHPLFRSFGQSGRTNPVALLKAAMEMQGYSVGPPRLPFMPATQQEMARIRTVLNTLDLPEGVRS